MNKYTIKPPRDPEHESQEPSYTWWRIFEQTPFATDAARCIALVADSQTAEVITSMLRFRQEELGKIKQEKL